MRQLMRLVVVAVSANRNQVEIDAGLVTINSCDMVGATGRPSSSGSSRLLCGLLLGNNLTSEYSAGALPVGSTEKRKPWMKRTRTRTRGVFR
jgi:hypothetical protein